MAFYMFFVKRFSVLSCSFAVGRKSRVKSATESALKALTILLLLFLLFLLFFRLFTVPNFSVKSLRSIVQSDGPPSWFTNASENRGECKNRVGGGRDVHSVLHSPQFSLAFVNQDGGQSDWTIDLYDFMEKKGTVNSLAVFLTYNF